MTYDDVIISPIRKVLCKIEFTDQNGITLQSIDKYILSGNISIEWKNSIRRSLTLQLDNSSSLFNYSSDGLISLNSRIKVFTGFESNGFSQYNQRGYFIPSNLRYSKNDNGERILQLEALDFYSMLDSSISGTIANQFLIPVGTPIQDAINLILTDVGWINPIIISPSLSGITCPYTLTITAGQNYSDLLIALAGMVSFEVFVDRFGTFRFQEPISQTSTAPIYNFKDDGTEPLFISATRNVELDKIRNSIVVYGDNVYGSTYTATAQDINIFSDTYIDKIGLRTEVITDSNISSNQLAIDRASYELQQKITLQDTLDLECLPIDIIEESNIVIVDSNDLGIIHQNYIVQSINYPLVNSGTMSTHLAKSTSNQVLI